MPVVEAVECIMDQADRDSLSDVDNDLLEDVYHYLTEKLYKDGLNQNQKRVIRKKANNFYIQCWWWDDIQEEAERKEWGIAIYITINLQLYNK